MPRDILTLLASWTYAKAASLGTLGGTIGKTIQFYEHLWPPFVGIDSTPDSQAYVTKGFTLQPGNYEWPFQAMLGGDITESVEGTCKANITYRLKATVARRKLACDLHTYKHLRIIRTFDAPALSFSHTINVENVWLNKIDYSITGPRTAIAFGSSVALEIRVIPLLKGIELGNITVKLLEVHEIILPPRIGYRVRDYNKEKEIDRWTVNTSRDEHWQSGISSTGREGWVVNTSLNLPRELKRCLQDVDAKGIKIRHKLKLAMALKNLDGHISELCSTLPVTIFISPDASPDEEGNLEQRLPCKMTAEEIAAITPPGYGEHVVDQLCVFPGDRLRASYTFRGGSSADSVASTPSYVFGGGHHSSAVPLILHKSGPDSPNSIGETSKLSKVPSYKTAVKTPAKPLSYAAAFVLPDYHAAIRLAGYDTTQDVEG